MRAVLALLVLGLALSPFVPMTAQDKPAPKPPFEYKLTGDTVDNCKITMVVNQKVDQSTARGVVEAYLGFDDGRESTHESSEAVRALWDEMMLKELTALEDKLLAPEARKALAKARKGVPVKPEDRVRVAQSSEVKSETKSEDGATIIETTQKVLYRIPDKTGKINEQSEEERRRFTCAKGEDGKWRINQMERLASDYDSETGERVLVWKDHSQSFGVYVHSIDVSATERVEPRQDTPENAALSLYDALFPRKFALLVRYFTLLTSDVRIQMRSLVSQELAGRVKKALDKEVEGAAEKGPEAALAAEPATDGKDGTKIVKFKKSREWLPDVQVTLKQVEGKWLVVEAGVWENNRGIDNGPHYRAMENIYDLPRP